MQKKNQVEILCLIHALIIKVFTVERLKRIGQRMCLSYGDKSLSRWAVISDIAR
jgi:hypothetical protein